MVEKISNVSSPAASAGTRIETSISLAEPDVAWVAERQSAINDGHPSPGARRRSDHDGGPTDEQDSGDGGKNAADPVISKLSGESERIGTGNLDEDDVPFGRHTGFI